LVLKGTSTWLGGYKINGKKMKIVYTAEVKALEQPIIDLNAFIDKFTIVGGKHYGYIREFNCGEKGYRGGHIGPGTHRPVTSGRLRLGWAPRSPRKLVGKLYEA
jgi:hypothetical protein